ncbi:MAG: glycosyltransferase, partial [Micavibrio sp.]|nr:glycosyltransferase [Micavibrio sp.]
LHFLEDYPKNLLEIIVVDGGSKDRTLEVIQNFDVNLIKAQKSSRAHFATRRSSSGRRGGSLCRA